jgi:L,D-transpeptidase catalytic domain
MMKKRSSLYPNSLSTMGRFMFPMLAAAVTAATVAGCGASGNTPQDDPHAGPTLAARGVDSSGRTDAQLADTARRGDSAMAVRPGAPAEVSFPEIRYTRLPISSRAVLDSIRKKYAKTKESSDAFRAITTLNRKEFGYIRMGDTIITPDTVIGDLRAYSVFPARYPAADTIKKLIVLSNKYQSYACYEYGRLVRFAACNTGTERKATFPGRYALNWRERLRISSLNDNWKLPYTFNFHLYAGNAFHQFAMPGRPVSHSCVRQFMTDAEWLFNWGEGGVRDSAGIMVPLSGTPVIIIDVFDFSRPKGGPWLELASNRENVIALPDNPMGMEEAWIPMSQVPASARGMADRQRYLVAEDTLRARGHIRPDVKLSASINYNALRKAKERRSASNAARKAKSQESAPPAPVQPSGGGTE